MSMIEARGAMSSATSGDVLKHTQYSVLHFILLVVFSGLATTAAILRLWARKIQKQAFAIHDYLTVLGLIFALAEAGVSVYGCCFIVQRKEGTVPEKLGLQLLFLSPILWVTAVTTIRAAIISLYIHLFPPRWFLVTCYGVLAVNVAFGASAIIADCLICRPITYRWAPDMIDGSCGDQRSLDMYIAVLNCLQDIVIVILPMPVLWGLQMARSKKVALSGMFGIGTLICAITIYRVQATSTIGDPTTLHAQDTYCLVALLTSLEALLGVISACLPMLKPLLLKLKSSMSEHRTKTSKHITSATVPVAMHAAQTSDLRKQSSGASSASTTDSSWRERDVEGQREKKSLV